MAARSPVTVDAFFSELDHPLKPALRVVCAAMLGASPKVDQGIKWNAPSFFVGDGQYFATANIHARGKPGETVLVVLHRGAKARAGRVTVADPDGLLEWLSPDRAAARFQTLAEARRRAPALRALTRQWITEL